MMDRKKIKIAVAEAKRFIQRVEALPEPAPYEVNGHTFMNDSFPRESGAVRRASMDLTRALADMRKPS